MIQSSDFYVCNNEIHYSFWASGIIKETEPKDDKTIDKPDNESPEEDDDEKKEQIYRFRKMS